MTTAQAYFEETSRCIRHVIDKHRRIIAEIIADCQESDIQSSHGEVGTDEAKTNARIIASVKNHSKKYTDAEILEYIKKCK